MYTYEELYRSKLTTAKEIASRLTSGMTVMTDIGLSQPYTIYTAIGERMVSGEIKNITINTMLDIYPMPWYKQNNICKENRVISWFSGAQGRWLVNNGLSDVMPNTYWDISEVIHLYKEYDYVCLTVSSMDKHGYFSTGINASCIAATIKKSKHIVLEVNKNMPRSLAGPMIHISQVDAICENHMPLVTMPPTQLDDISIRIGETIAEEIPSGATLQLGIGAIPDAVGMALKNKKNLGIHTEMLTDSMIELLECGAADNSLKPIYRGKTVATFALGSKKMYDYIDDNPSMMLLPVEEVNNPYIIAQHDNFMSINSALEVDFYGQVCAESVGFKNFSGSGGQLDYVRGATMSKGGKSFIAFPSTAKNGTISKIQPILTSGSQVTTSKNEVDMIVTEYGIAKLRGKSLSERTKALIAIAHPKFRDELTFEAKKLNIMI